MSTFIDERIVEMKFNNADFEKKAKQTIDTLKKLKQNLKFSNVADDINDSFEDIDASPMTKAIDQVSAKISMLDVLAANTLIRIQNRIIDTGERLVKSLSVDNIMVGYSKYEEKIASVQTLMNALPNKSIDEINGYLEKLMTFSDETSYSFTEMSNALGSLVSKGADIDKMVPMIEGIANATAFAGKGAQAFSSAILNIGQSYGGGYLTNIDYKSIVGQGVNSSALSKAFIDTAKALGKLDKTGRTAKGTLVTISNIGETLSEKWLDKEVMEEAFGYFAAMTTEAHELVKNGTYETFSEAYAEIADNYDIVQSKAAKAAQEAKSFSEAISATKDAVSSGWMRTFELIFGDYIEAKRLWTGVADGLWEVFASGAKRRNEIVAEWGLLGGREDIIRSLTVAFENIVNVIHSFKDAWTDVFGEMSGATLARLTDKFATFLFKLVLSEETLEDLKSTFKGVFSVLKFGLNIISSILNLLKPFVGPLLSIVRISLRLLAIIGDITSGALGLINMTRILKTVLMALGTILAIPLIAIVSLVGLVVKLTKALYNLFKQSKAGVFAISIFTKLASTIGYGMSKLAEYISAIQTFLANLYNGGYTYILSEIANKFGKVSSAIENYFKTLRGGESAVNRFKRLFTTLKTTISNFFSGISKWLKGSIFGDAYTKMVSVFDGIKTKVTDLIALFDRFAKSLTPGRVAAYAFTMSMLLLSMSLSKMFVGVTNLTTTFTGMFTNLSLILKKAAQKTNAFKNVAEALVLISGSIIALTFAAHYYGDDLLTATKTLAALAVILGGLTGVVGLISYAFKKFDFKENFYDVAKGVLALSASVTLLAGALYILKDVRFTTEMLKNLIPIAGALGLVVTAAFVLGKFKSISVKGVGSVVLLSGSLYIIAKSLEKLNKVNLKDSKEQVDVLVAFMVALGSLAFGLGKLNWKGILAFAIAAGSFHKFIDALTYFNTPEFKALLGNVIPAITEMFKDTKTMFFTLGKIGLLSATLGHSAKAISSALIGLTLSISAMVGLAILVNKAGVSIEAVKTFVYDMMQVMLSFGMLAAMVSIIPKENGIKSFTKSLGSFLIFAASLMGLSYIVSKINFTDLMDTITMFNGFIIAYAAMIGIAGNAQGTEGAGKAIKAMTNSLVVIIGEMIVLSIMCSDSQLLPGIEAATSTLSWLAVALGAMVYLASINIPAGDFSGVNSMLRSLIGIMATMAVMSSFGTVDTIVASGIVVLGVLSIVMLVMTRMSTTTKLVAQESKKTDYMQVAKAIALACSGISLMIGSIAVLANTISKMEYDAITLTITTALAAVGLVIGGLFALSKWNDGRSLVTASMAIAIASLSILEIAGAMAIMAKATKTVKIDEFNWMASWATAMFAAVSGVVIILGMLASKAPQITLYAGLVAGAIGVLIWTIGDLVTKIGNAASSILSNATNFAKTLIEGIKTIMWALQEFTSMDLSFNNVDFGRLTSLLAILSVFSRSFKGNAFGSFVGMTGIGILALSLCEFAKVDYDAIDTRKLYKLLDVFSDQGLMAGLSTVALLAGGMGIASLGAGLRWLDSVNYDAINTNKITELLNAISVSEAFGGLMANAFITGGIGLFNLAMGLVPFGWIKYDTIDTSVITKLLMAVAGWGLPAATAGMALGISAMPIMAFTVAMTGLYKSLETMKPEVFSNSINYAVQGIAQGIAQNIPLLLKMGGIFGVSFLGGFYDSVGQHSPWWTTVLSVGYAALGIKQGVDENKSLLENLGGAFGGYFIGDMKDSMVSNAGEAVEGLTGYLENIAGYLEDNYGINIPINFDFNMGRSERDAYLKSISHLPQEAQKYLTNEYDKKHENGLISGWFNDKDDITKSLTDPMNEAMESMTNAMGGAGAAAKTFKETMRDTIASSISYFSEFSAKTDLTAEDMLKNMQSQIDGINQWTSNMAELANRGISQELYSKLAEMGPTASYEYVNALMGMNLEQLGDANSKFAALLTLPDSAASSIEESYKQTGAMFSQGFALGIQPDAANKRAEALGLESVSALEEVLGIHSPSRVTYDDGLYAVMGFANGIKDHFAVVGNSIFALGKYVSKQFDTHLDGVNVGKKFMTDFVSNISVDTDSIKGNHIQKNISAINAAILSGIDTQPTIAPVLDLTNVQNGMGYFNNSTSKMGASLAVKDYTEMKMVIDNNNNRLADSIKTSNELMAGDIVNAIGKLDKEANVNVYLQGNAAGVFRLVRVENDKYIKSTGTSPLIPKSATN